MVGNVVPEDEEKAEILHVFFTSVFNSQACYPQGAQPLDLEDRNGEQDKLPRIQEETVSNLLLHLDCHKSVGLEGMHPRVQRELV